MEEKHLLWIVPSALLFGFLIGALFYAVLNSYEDVLMLEMMLNTLKACEVYIRPN